MADMDKHPTRESIGRTVDLFGDRAAYAAAIESLLATVVAPRESISPAELIHGSLVASADIVVRADNLLGENKDLRDRFTFSTLERLSAQAILTHDELKNLPLESFQDQVAKLRQTIIAHQTATFQFPSSSYWSTFNDHVHSLNALKQTQSVLEKTPLSHKESRLAAALEWENDGLFAAVRQLQKYGVSPVYIADNTQLPIVDWHVYDFLAEARQNPASLKIFSPSLAPMVLARFGGFTASLIDQTPVTQRFERGWRLDYGGLVAGRSQQTDPDMAFNLHDDGHLYATYGTPLSWLAAELGLTAQYELVRAQVLSLYTDLVVPAYLVDDSEDIKVAEQTARRASRPRTRDFLKLVVARRRLIDQHPNLLDLVEREAKSQSRLVRRHGVVGFIRRLPAGHRASQTQRDLCWQDQGIELPPTGETYVRAHARGGNRPTVDPAIAPVHRAQLRYLGGVAVDSQPDQPEWPPESSRL